MNEDVASGHEFGQPTVEIAAIDVDHVGDRDVARGVEPGVASRTEGTGTAQDASREHDRTGS